MATMAHFVSSSVLSLVSDSHYLSERTSWLVVRIIDQRNRQKHVTASSAWR